MNNPTGWHALSPMWHDKSPISGQATSHSVVFFLNPHHQAKNNFGWFTVEQLEAWCTGEGPIPKTAAAA